MNEILQQGPLAVFTAFLVMHVLADFPLQGDYIAKQKTRLQADSLSVWITALTAHCIIHAGGVWLISGSLTYFAAEFITHALIDVGKGEGRFSLVSDQLLHLGCKLIYTLLLTHPW